MKKKSNISLLLITALISACSGNVNPLDPGRNLNGTIINKSQNINTFLSENEITEFDKEYSFSTQALTESYLLRKLENWFTKDDGVRLVKEIAYARYKHPVLFCTVMLANNETYENIKGVQKVKDRSSVDPGFKNFVEGCGNIGEYHVNTYTTSYQQLPAIAMDSSGNYAITWQSNDQNGDQYYGIFAQRYFSNGIPNGSEFHVNTLTSSHQSHPAIAMDSDGDFVITWSSRYQYGDLYDGVIAQRYHNDGTKNGPEIHVNTFTNGEQQNSSVAMDFDGDFVVSWISQNQDGDDGFGVFGQMFHNDGSPNGSEFHINTFSTGQQQDPSIAMDEDGDFVVTWSGKSDTNNGGNKYGIFAQRYHNDGSTDGSEFHVNTFGDISQKHPSVAMNGIGEFVIAWDSRNQPDDKYGVYAREYHSDGNPVADEFRVNSYTTDSQSLPSTAIDSAGNFIITWQSRDQATDPGDGVFGQRFNNGGTFAGSEFHINTFTLDMQQQSSVAMDGSGDFVVAWQSYNQTDDISYGIFAQRYNSNGEPQR
jgi:hypothetical protein